MSFTCFAARRLDNIVTEKSVLTQNVSTMVSKFSVINRLTVVQLLFCRFEKTAYPQNSYMFSIVTSN